MKLAQGNSIGIFNSVGSEDLCKRICQLIEEKGGRISHLVVCNMWTDKTQAELY